MIKECFRVLKKGGKAAFSIWGRREVSPMFTLLPPLLAKYNIPNPSSGERNNFHLGNKKEELRGKFLEIGFQNCLVWTQPMICSFFDADEFTTMTLAIPSTKALLADVPADVYENIKNDLKEQAKKFLDEGTPLALELEIFVAIK